MNVSSKTDALAILQENEVNVSLDEEIMFPRKAQFIDEVHDAIEYLIDNCDFGIRYI